MDAFEGLPSAAAKLVLPSAAGSQRMAGGDLAWVLPSAAAMECWRGCKEPPRRGAGAREKKEGFAACFFFRLR